MSELDETIRIAGRSTTIVRDAGNVGTFMYSDKTGLIIGKRKSEPYFDYEVAAWLPSDSTVVSGDLILQGSTYYLVMSVDQDYIGDDLQRYSCMLYECNSVVSLYSYNDISRQHDTLVKAGVNCLITQVRASAQKEDKNIAIKGYGGKRQPFQYFMRDSEGLTNISTIVDQDNRSFKVNKQFDIFIADGIVQTQVIWEG